MGVLEGRARSATVRAVENVEAELIERQAFLKRVSAEPELARKLLVRMSARLRDVEDMLTQVYASHDAGATGGQLVAATPTLEAPPTLTLTGATYAAKFFIGPDPIRIPRLPFTIGRRHDQNEPSSVITPDLAISEDPPHRLSRAHFMLIRDDDDILVRDLNSTLGTIVNGQPLGHDFPIDSAPLRKGENNVVAGGAGSPFTFVVTLS
jgi:hypothetical protein